RMGAQGFEHIVYTDIARDGMQTGVDNGAYARMAAAFGNPVIVSGGISSAADIAALGPIADAVEGVIAGRAIYEGTLSVADGVAACVGTYRVSDQLEAEEKPLTIEDLEA
ncbi:HisA/HisF-related TIM barrel protein, partial [uncultured Adlercreutzia sp.]|uniref:HisA/HisF-related TIM barrel protein n=1 Tax=uncultured Adlercreutzia sp. TaxID=875803 RepID=UPI0025A6341F